ncbi:putative calcium-binding protein CML32 [Astathelohania contejeani]|uniref:Calcium-binding protein CML32 n=1 Tax=Astathelohania contejeani TaxID=164912 RepID=A0ABQ7I057_9MICR|nr:putative calcium-binding protein CML32 [Thelohania contejeani]
MEREIKHLFERINKSKSGFITKEEFDDYLNLYDLKKAGISISKVKFGDNGLSIADFTKLYDKNKLFEPVDVEEAFAVIDKDNDGMISRIELVSFFKRLGIHKSDDQIDMMIRIADTNGDGYVSLEEFKEVMKKCK